MLDQRYQEAEATLAAAMTVCREASAVPLSKVPMSHELAEALHEVTKQVGAVRLWPLIKSIPGGTKTATDLLELHHKFCSNGHHDKFHPPEGEPEPETVSPPVDSLRPALPIPPADLADLPDYLRQVYVWICGELDGLFEVVPPLLVERLPPPGDRYLFEDWAHIAAVVQRVTELSRLDGMWQAFQRQHGGDWFSEETELNRFSFIRTVCLRYTEIVTPVPNFDAVEDWE